MGVYIVSCLSHWSPSQSRVLTGVSVYTVFRLCYITRSRCAVCYMCEVFYYLPMRRIGYAARIHRPTSRRPLSAFSLPYRLTLRQFLFFWDSGAGIVVHRFLSRFGYLALYSPSPVFLGWHSPRTVTSIYIKRRKRLATRSIKT